MQTSGLCFWRVAGGGQGKVKVPRDPRIACAALVRLGELSNASFAAPSSLLPIQPHVVILPCAVMVSWETGPQWEVFMKLKDLIHSPLCRSEHPAWSGGRWCAGWLRQVQGGLHPFPLL